MKELYNVVEKLQNEKRYKHTLGVVETAMKLGTIYDVDTQKCELAALLHDVTKQLDKESQEVYVSQINDQFVQDNPPLWHAFTGAIYARDEVGISDVEVLDAIKFHTLGKVNSSDLGKIIYLADFLEPGRTIEQVEGFRNQIGNVSLNKLYEIVAKSRIEYEIQSGHQLHPLTRELYESII